MAGLLVSIFCQTYNHEPYIRQCIEGFLMQKTDFSFEVLVHDDASTDQTADIVREYEVKYPDIIKPIYQTENQFSKGISISITFQYPRAKGKYIAFCEGDDYWIDPLKLQKQVDLLEKYEDVGLVYSKARCFQQSTNKFRRERIGDQYCIFRNLILFNSIPSLTTCYRKDIYSNYLKDIHPEKLSWVMGDYPTWLYFALHSKVKFINEIQGVYRILENSASHSKNVYKQLSFNESTYKIRMFYLSKENGKEIDRLKKKVIEEFLYAKFLLLLKSKMPLDEIYEDIRNSGIISFKMTFAYLIKYFYFLRFFLIIIPSK